MKSKFDVVKAANPTLEIQNYLRDIARFHNEIPKVFPTGKYDSQTQKAVSEFQRLFNLPITGKIDFATWEAITKQHKLYSHRINSPNSVRCFPNNIHEYKKGDKNNLINILQIILMNYKRKYRNYPDVNISGLFDDQTEMAIKHFQKCSNLPVTGVLDRRTWNILNIINENSRLYE